MTRARVLAVVAVALVAAALPASASASRLVTWTTPSRYVDVRTEPFGIPPPGAGPEKRLHVNVLLPRGYDGRRRFPVVYLLHGAEERYDWAANRALGDVAHVARGLRAVIVMPDSGAVGWNTDWWNGGRRGGPAWERYHLGELIPLVERRLKIRRGRRWHAIGGFSMGGEGAAYYATQRPGYFGSTFTFSAPLSLGRPETIGSIDYFLAGYGRSHEALFGDPQGFYLAGHDPRRLAASLRQTRVYVTHGDGTYRSQDELSDGRPSDVGMFAVGVEVGLVPQTLAFLNAARAAGVDVTYRPGRGTHDYAYYGERLRGAIRWGLFRPVPRRPSSWTYRTVAQRGRMWSLGFAFARPPEEVVTFRVRGRIVSASGSGAVRIRDRCGRAIGARLPFRRALPAGPWARCPRR
jgi:S-formylglutathione hydrolase FrmB